MYEVAGYVVGILIAMAIGWITAKLIEKDRKMN